MDCGTARNRCACAAEACVERSSGRNTSPCTPAELSCRVITLLLRKLRVGAAGIPEAMRGGKGGSDGALPEPRKGPGICRSPPEPRWGGCMPTGEGETLRAPRWARADEEDDDGTGTMDIRPRVISSPGGE